MATGHAIRVGDQQLLKLVIVSLLQIKNENQITSLFHTTIIILVPYKLFNDDSPFMISSWICCIFCILFCEWNPFCVHSLCPDGVAGSAFNLKLHNFTCIPTTFIFIFYYLSHTRTVVGECHLRLSCMSAEDGSKGGVCVWEDVTPRLIL